MQSVRTLPQQLYVIAESPNGPCKIGFAYNPKKRLAELQQATYRKLVLHFHDETTNHRQAERHAHSLVWPKHLSGEWFDITVNTAIKAVQDALDLTDETNKRRRLFKRRKPINEPLPQRL